MNQQITKEIENLIRNMPRRNESSYDCGVSWGADFASGNLMHSRWHYELGRFDKAKEQMAAARKNLESAIELHNSSGRYCRIGLPSGNPKRVEGVIKKVVNDYNELAELYGNDPRIGQLELIEFRPRCP